MVAYDFGIKTSILRRLTAAGCRVEVVPASTTAADVLARRPDGVFLSNGPGDPAGVVGAPDAIRGLLGEVPVFGICLGHQLLGLALGGTTYKLPFGHHGANHPVRHESSGGVVEITSQNHNYAVDADSLRWWAAVPRSPTSTSTTGSSRGLRVESLRAFSVQYHPEAAPGPHDAAYLFDEFTALMGVPMHSGPPLMPKRTDIDSILVIGSGPIVIGQACEFDYSGTQACRVLRQEGYRVVLVNSNPATIMTDPELADATYIEPLDLDTLTRVIEKERPDALLPTLGGQTALNLAVAAAEAGVLDRFGVELIGAGVDAIHTAEDRSRFKAAMIEIGLSVPRSGIAYSLDEALVVGEEIGFPLIIRPSFILGGGGTGFATDPTELEVVAANGLSASPVGEILLEQSIAGWKEYELEVMRDRADNAVVVCSIENLDPMGVHTGDSITVAPAQTLTDVEYQRMRDAAFACIRRIGVDTGGSNIQFAVNPANGEMVVIEMNPRVSRSAPWPRRPPASPSPRSPPSWPSATASTRSRTTSPARRRPRSSRPSTTSWSRSPLRLREVLRRAARARHEDAVGGRGHGHRPHLHRVAPEGGRSLETGRLGLNGDPGEAAYDALDDDELVRRAAVATPTGSSISRRRCGGASASSASTR